MGNTVLLTGATGFVGQHLYGALVGRGYQVRCATRRPMDAARRDPSRDWVALDLDQPHTVAQAMEGVDGAYFLVHGMTGSHGGDYVERERKGAHAFASAAAKAGLRRLVYLGGMAPRGPASRHLRSRMVTGKQLRDGAVPCVELRAAMVIGAGSASWRIVRDLAARLPVMVLPRWLSSVSAPIGVDDAVAALVDAYALPEEQVGCYDIPGPEVLSAAEILMRVSRLRGTRPVTIGVPLITPRLSSLWIQLVTRADGHLARELVEGLTSDIVPSQTTFWELAPRTLTPLDEAFTRALEGESGLPLRAQALERTVQWLSRPAH